MSLIGFKATNHPQQTAARGADDNTDDRRTLTELFNPLHMEHGFTLDVAASSANTKCARYFSKEMDGLKQSWAHEVVWCNPPYSDLRSWVEKANHEVVHGGCNKVVMLLPANRTEQKWWQDLVEPMRDKGKGVTVRFLKGRHRFGWPEDRVTPKKGDRPPFGLVLVIFERTKA